MIIEAAAAKTPSESWKGRYVLQTKTKRKQKPERLKNKRITEKLEIKKYNSLQNRYNHD